MTDIEECGFSKGKMDIPGRYILLTVDFEAFKHEFLGLWCKAMHYWAEHAKKYGLSFCFFISVENIVKLRANDKVAYSEFIKAAKLLNKSGTLFYPHNHSVFDPGTGDRPVFSEESRRGLTGYSKRKSMYYDVVYRCAINIDVWLNTIRKIYEDFIEEAECTKPANMAFRAGGWDYGSSCDDIKKYINGLFSAGFSVDSSACSGVFDTPTWRVGKVYGSNVFQLNGDVTEVAPCWSMDCGMDLFSLPYLKHMYKLGFHKGLWTGRTGAFVVVLHFDHLFHDWNNRNYDYFAVKDFRIVEKRINRLFRFISLLQLSLRLKCVTFDGLKG